MKLRALWFTLVVGVTSMSSGCCCFRECFPNVGWRLHPGKHCGSAPACTPPVCCPTVGAMRAPMVVPGGPDCCGGPVVPGPVFTQPAGYPMGPFPPVIGPVQPLPGSQLNNPTPVPMGKPGN